MAIWFSFLLVFNNILQFSTTFWRGEQFILSFAMHVLAAGIKKKNSLHIMIIEVI